MRDLISFNLFLLHWIKKNCLRISHFLHRLNWCSSFVIFTECCIDCLIDERIDLQPLYVNVLIFFESSSMPIKLLLFLPFFFFSLLHHLSIHFLFFSSLYLLLLP